LGAFYEFVGGFLEEGNLVLMWVGFGPLWWIIDLLW
jgi:hypothetical protein